MSFSNDIVADGQYTRSQVLGQWGKRHHVPAHCGAPVRSKNNTPCPCTPTWCQQGRWTCGKHRAIRGPPPFECPICYEPCVRAADAYTTPCKHRFHHACMDRWAASTVTPELHCPLCRHVLDDHPFPHQTPPVTETGTPTLDTIITMYQDPTFPVLQRYRMMRAYIRRLHTDLAERRAYIARLQQAAEALESSA